MSWIKVYNEGKEFKELTGGSTMKKVRKTILEEQIAIVKDCLSHNRNYGAMALKYNCSYQQVRNWVDCYEKIRSTGLEADEESVPVSRQAAHQKKNSGTA